MTFRRRGLLGLPLLALAGSAHAQTKLAVPLSWYGVRVTIRYAAPITLAPMAPR